MLRIRLFAAARHAVGRSEFTVEGLGLSEPTTVGDIVDGLTAVAPGAKRVLEGCAVLVDGERCPREYVIEQANSVDLLPPFAGG